MKGSTRIYFCIVYISFNILLSMPLGYVIFASDKKKLIGQF